MIPGLKKTSLFLVLALTALASQSVFGQDGLYRDGHFNVRSATTLLQDGVYQLDARLQLLLSDESNEALTSGVPIRIALELEVIRSRRFLPDATDVKLDLQYELEYRPLSQRYLVRSINDGEQESFATLYSALNNLGRLQNVPVVAASELQDDGRYRVRLRALLSTRDYPAPLRMLFFWRDQWQLRSDWYQWDLER